MVNWARLPAGKEFAAHYHEDMQEIFIILSGEALIRVDDQEATLGQGDAVLIEPREVHQMRNDGNKDVDFISIGVAQTNSGQQTTRLLHDSERTQRKP